MYLSNGIVYANEPTTEIKVKEVKPLSYGMLLLTFTSGEKRLFDTTILQGSAFRLLADEKIFKDVFVAHGVVSWVDGEIDCAPEYMYENSFIYEEELVI